MNKAQHCWRCEKACTQQCSRCKVAFYCSKECQKQDKWRHKPDCDSANVKRTCLSCGLEQSGTMQCTNCLDAAYCSVECQKNHWERHRRICQDTVDRTLKLADDIKELNKKISVISGGVIGTYYWGNMPAVDLLNLPMNEGETFADPLSLLLCGVGDPRNVLLTIASLLEVYKQSVTFVLNDICPCTLARTILLLYMLYKGILSISIYLLLVAETLHQYIRSFYQNYPAGSLSLSIREEERRPCQPPRHSLICRLSKEMDESVQFRLVKPVFLNFCA